LGGAAPTEDPGSVSRRGGINEARRGYVPYWLEVKGFPDDGGLAGNRGTGSGIGRLRLSSSSDARLSVNSWKDGSRGR
jgi:hypothetical protein